MLRKINPPEMSSDPIYVQYLSIMCIRKKVNVAVDLFAPSLPDRYRDEPRTNTLYSPEIG
jgi:hypothetical protein